MRTLLSMLAAAACGVLIAWSGPATASCQGCPPGYECYIPKDLGWHFGYCVEKSDSKDEVIEVDEPACMCRNDGRYKDEVYLYPCSCGPTNWLFWAPTWHDKGVTWGSWTCSEQPPDAATGAWSACVTPDEEWLDWEQILEQVRKQIEDDS